MSQEVLEKTIFVRRGTLPVLLSVPHDGTLDSIGGVPLALYSGSKPRDFAVRPVARDIFIHILRSSRKSPDLLIQRVHRSFISSQIQSYFENKVINFLSEPTSSYRGEMGKVLLIDLHGFTKQPEFGEFDLILGTGHRQTVGESSVDYDFSSFMMDRGYRVYVPSEKPIPGELYPADRPSWTLV